jgi:hypothetical protein
MALIEQYAWGRSMPAFLSEESGRFLKKAAQRLFSN